MLAAVDLEGLGDDFLHGHARVEAGDGVLEDELGFAAEGFDVARGVDGVAEPDDLAARRRARSWRAARARVDLPEPDSPTTPTRLAGLDVEVDAVDGA